jgi:two-component system, chemotaxis family, protein-glutamate methylesterase/glutaminase
MCPCSQIGNWFMIQDLKIFIVENNDVYRTFLSKVVANIEGTHLDGAVADGRMAACRLKHTPVDLVLLQLEMPGMDGVKILEKLQESHPDIGVIALSASQSQAPEKTVKALQMGALDCISNAAMDVSDAGALALRRRLMTLIGLFRARRNSRMAKRLHEEHAPMPKVPISRDFVSPVPRYETVPQNGRQASERPAKPIVTNPRIDLLAIGVSTGGPNALAELIPLLPADLGIPLLIVQHMPAVMTASLAESLNRKSALQVHEAVDGEEVLPNIVYIASGGTHMTVAREQARNPSQKRRIQLTSDPPVNSCRPSVDVLFRSIAEAYDGSILAVIMTGMGSDGTEGVRALKQKGCYCLAQTEETCVVYGMPRAIVEAGLSDEKVPLHNMHTGFWIL